MFQRLNRTLGRAYHRAMGAVVGLVALAAFRVAWSAGMAAHLAGALIFSLAGIACGALAWWCFRPERRLTDLES